MEKDDYRMVSEELEPEFGLAQAVTQIWLSGDGLSWRFERPEEGYAREIPEGVAFRPCRCGHFAALKDGHWNR